jgi:hypothetical protein
VNQTELQTTLTLAGLAYRGFQDVLPGEPHDSIVRSALLAGLEGPDALAPVRDQWRLVWGPVTSRMPLGAFDSSAMFVVQSVAEPHRHVVAVRGTNPVASADWLFGDFWVATTVPWPGASDGAAVSASTALGLAALQQMRSRSGSLVAEVAERTRRRIGGLIDDLVQGGRASVARLGQAQARTRASLEKQVEQVVNFWETSLPERIAVLTNLRSEAEHLSLTPDDLCPRWDTDTPFDGGTTLLTFLRRAAARATVPLDVTVTGHSKGGALAPVVALWLAESRAGHGRPDAQCWDSEGNATVRSVAFAAPTPGNTAFAARLDATLANAVRITNDNDAVTRAWAASDISLIPALYGERSDELKEVVAVLAHSVTALGYAHPTRGVTSFSGDLDDRRLLPVELVHQHMDAYLVHAGLFPTIDALTFFVG